MMPALIRRRDEDPCPAVILTEEDIEHGYPV